MLATGSYRYTEGYFVLNDEKYYDIGIRFIDNYVIKNAIDKLENDEEIRHEIERRKLNQIPFQNNMNYFQKWL